MTPMEFIILFIIAYFLKELLDEIILRLYSAITGKRVKEVIIKWSYKK